MEKIKIIDIQEKETEYEMTFAMLLAHARMHGSQIIRIGEYRCLFKVFSDDLDAILKEDTD